ncbi:MAG: hypothetical protein V7647_2733 [Acidobacteriota bacterium]|jgi:hypothetical protein
MRRVTIAGVCVLALLSPAVDARDQQQVIINGPSRDRAGVPGMASREIKTGTGRIRGRVLSAETGSAVRRVQVRVFGPDIGMKLATTDDDGRFEFRGLPAGRFSLSATKSGYVSAQYGQTRPFESGKPLELADGQILDKANILIPRGSAITGRILDEFGEPVTEAMVAAMRSVWSNGQRRLQPAGRMMPTNDLGQFRLYGLPAGDYYISATLRDTIAMEVSMMGTPTAANSVSAAGYAPTYFPGTANGSDAQKITIAAGQDAHNTDFALLPVRLARITGVVIGSDGKPSAGSMVTAMSRNGDNMMGMMLGGSSSRTNRDGTFTLAGLPPGEFILQSRTMQIMTTGSGDMMSFSATISEPGTPQAESGSVVLAVNGEDLGNVVITQSKGATASGQITFADGARPSNMPALRVMAIPSNEISMMGSGPPAQANADGTFELRGLAGAFVLRVVNLPQGWMLRSVLVNGEDVTDRGMEFKGTESIAGIEIVVTSKVTELSGAVKGPSGAPVKDYTVMVFSDDPERWTIPNSRYVVSARPDQEGRFKLRGLPPGGYYAAAADYLAQGEWGDPELLERIKTKASRITLEDGEKKVLDLKLDR